MRLVPYQSTGGPRDMKSLRTAADTSTEAIPAPATSLWRPRFFFLLGMLALLLLLVAGCSTGKQSTWDPLGPVADKQLELFNVLLWVMVAVFVFVEGILLYAIIRYRSRPGRVPSRTHGNLPLEIAWTIIPTILVLGLGIWSVFTLFELDEPPSSEQNVLQVNVTAHQWWWEFEYPDAGGGKRITTANELRIPVDRAVKLNLNSDDVLHSFWVPKLAGKLDIIPTRTNKMWFKADSDKIDSLPATLYGQCAELCGVAHALMRFRVHVLSEDDYEEWVSNFGPPTPLTGRAEEGKTTFLVNCAICHTINPADPVTGKSVSDFDDSAAQQSRLENFLTGDDLTLVPAPNLTDLRFRQTIGAGLMDLNVQNLRKWLHNPDDVKPGNLMAAKAPVYRQGTLKGNINLSEDEVEGLIEYLLQLQ